MYLKQSHKIGVFIALVFIVCFLWFYINPVASNLHTELFKLSFIGFQEMNLFGFILGLIQSYIWGYFFVGLWQLTKKLTKS